MKGKLAVVIMLTTLVLSSILGGAGLAKNIDNNSPMAPTDGWISQPGNEFTEIEGDWEYSTGWCIRMSPCDGYCWANWEFNIGVPKIQDGSLQIGLYFCDLALYPWVKGPDLYVYNWNTGSYDGWQGVGNWDDFEWVWETPVDSNTYVNQGGIVRVHVYANADCDTIVNMVGVKYQELLGLPHIQVSPTSFTWKRVKPGSTIPFSFTIKNVGDDTSYLDWYIQDPTPKGATWSFNPRSGDNLPGGASVTVEGTLIVPEEERFVHFPYSYDWDIGIGDAGHYWDWGWVNCHLTTKIVWDRSLPMDGLFAHFFHGKFANYLEFVQTLINNK